MNIPNWWPHGVDEKPPDLDARIKALETKVEGMYESMIDWVGRVKAIETQLLWAKSAKKATARKIRDAIRRGRQK